MKTAAPEPMTAKPVQPSPSAVAAHATVAKALPLTADAFSKVQKKPAPVVSTVKATDRAGTAPEATGDAQFLRMDSTLMRVPASANSNAPQGVAQRSTNETLAQVQSLWNSGSHGAATELLQQALTQVESSSAVAAPVTGQSTLARIARELARLNLVDGQVNQALALLTRLEPQLAQIADLWAMRANAAQRLGQHAEAVKSYKQALILKPDEPRWMSGQAVSMAAQGQIAAAGEMAEKARAFGALRPEVATYLRQLGVSVRMD
jgi:tetratricopeptide (TPR) repeat protein